MFDRLRRVRTIMGYSLDASAVIVTYLVLYVLGYAGNAPVWCLAVGVLGAIQQQPRVQLWLSGGDLDRRVTLRMVVLLTTGTAFIYATGWGPLLLSGLSLVVAMHVRQIGPRVWRQGVLWTILCTLAGQGAVASGWVASYIPEPSSYGVAAAALVLCVLLIRTIGLAGEERLQAEATTQSAEKRFRAMVRDSADVIVLVDEARSVKYISPAIHEMTGQSPSELLDAGLQQTIHPDDLPSVLEHFQLASESGRLVDRVEARIHALDGTYRWTESRIRDLTGDPDVRGFVINIRDIQEGKMGQERLTHAATHDALTGLVNRAAFGSALDAVDLRDDAAVLFLDLDEFKEVNDTYGHQAGDALLIAASDVLRRSVPAGAVVGRFGGDEFGVILSGASAADAGRVAERILEEMLVPVGFADHQLRLRASIGVAAASAGRPAGTDELLRRADQAMYQAKRAGTHLYRCADLDSALV